MKIRLVKAIEVEFGEDGHKVFKSPFKSEVFFKCNKLSQKLTKKKKKKLTLLSIWGQFADTFLTQSQYCKLQQQTWDVKIKN